MRQLKLLKTKNIIVLSVEEKELWNQIRSDSNFSEFTDQEINHLFQIAKQYVNKELSLETMLDAGKKGMLKTKSKLSPELKPLKRAAMLVEFIRHSIVEKLN